MLPTFLALASWVPAVLGLGGLLVADVEEDLRPALAGFLGLAALAALGMALNLAAPLHPSFAVAVLVLGWAVFLARRRTLLPAAPATPLVALALVTLACAALTQLPGRHYDAGLYHLQAIEWVRERRQPLGLALLHDRLGFNVSWFTVGPLLEYPGLRSRSAHLVGSLPVVFGAWGSMVGLRRLAAGRRSFDNALLAALALPVSLAVGGLGSPGPDHVLPIVGFLVLALWASVLAAPPGRRGGLAVVAFLLSVFAATLKLPAACLPVASACFLWPVWRSLKRAQRALAIAGALGLALPWAARGLAASGCLAYPVAWTCLPALRWSVPPGETAAFQAMIAAWARAPQHVPGGILAPVGRAIPYFAAGDRLPTLALLTLTLAAGLMLSWRHLPRAPRGFWAVTGVALLGTALWAAALPDPRFGLVYLVPVAAAPLALALSDAASPRRARAALLVSCAAFAAWGAFDLRRLHASDLALARWPEFPAARVERRTTGTGLVLHVPIGGDDRCWEAPLPCTPQVRPGLVWTGTFDFEVDEPASDLPEPRRSPRFP